MGDMPDMGSGSGNHDDHYQGSGSDMPDMGSGSDMPDMGSGSGSDMPDMGSGSGSDMAGMDSGAGAGCDESYCMGTCMQWSYCMSEPDDQCANAPTDCGDKCGGCDVAGAGDTSTGSGSGGVGMSMGGDMSMGADMSSGDGF